MSATTQPYTPYDDGDWDARCKAQQAREAEAADPTKPQPYADQAEAHSMYAEDFGMDPEGPIPAP